MRKIVVTELVTLDGVIEAPGGSENFEQGQGGWSVRLFNDEYATYKHEELFAADALLLGRLTYQVFAAAWPGRSDEAVIADMDAWGGATQEVKLDGFAERMNSLPKYVVSTTLNKVEWNNSHLLKTNVVEEIAKLKQQPGLDILVLGSGELVRLLMAHDMVDEVRLMVHPIVLGSGKKLFQGVDLKKLTLTRTMQFETGIVVLEYSR